VNALPIPYIVPTPVPATVPPVLAAPGALTLSAWVSCSPNASALAVAQLPAAALTLGAPAPAAAAAASLAAACAWSAPAANNASTGCANGAGTCDGFVSLLEAQAACAAQSYCLAVTLAGGSYQLRAGAPSAGTSSVASGSTTWYLQTSAAAAPCRAAALQGMAQAANGVAPCVWAVSAQGMLPSGLCANGQSQGPTCEHYGSLAAAQAACAAQSGCLSVALFGSNQFTLLAGGAAALAGLSGATTFFITNAPVCRASGQQSLSLQVAPATWSGAGGGTRGTLLGGAAFVGACDATWHHLALTVVPGATSGAASGSASLLSQGAPCALSSPYPVTPYPCSLALDGNTNNFAQTNIGNPDGEWLSIDLGAAVRVASVTIVGRQDCCTVRLDNFLLFVGNSGGASDAASAGLNYGFNAQCPGSGTFLVSTAPAYTVTVPCPLVGRFVTIFVRNNYINVAEIGVYGTYSAPGSVAVTATAYFDGVPTWQGTQNLALPVLSAAVLLGAAGAGTGAAPALAQPFFGLLDDARIYARALAPAELLALAGPPFPATPNNTVAPARAAGASAYAWQCAPGWFGPPTTLLVRNADGSWNASTGAAFACAACAPAGSYCPGGASAVPCPAGSYAAASGAAAKTFANTCLPCPAGTFSPSAGAAGAGSCQACPAGSFSGEFATACAAPSGLLFDNTAGLTRFRFDWATSGAAPGAAGPLTASPWAQANVLAAPFGLDAAVDSVTALLLYSGASASWTGTASASLWDTAVGQVSPTPTVLSASPLSGAAAPVVTVAATLARGVPTAVVFNVSRAWQLAGGAQYAAAVSTSDTTGAVLALLADTQSPAPLAFGNSSLLYVAAARQTGAASWAAPTYNPAAAALAMVVRGVPAPIARAALDSTVPARALASATSLAGALLAPSAAAAFVAANATWLSLLRFRVFAQAAASAATYSLSATLFLASASGAPLQAVQAAAVLQASFTAASAAASTTAYDLNFSVPSGAAPGAWPALAAGRAYAVVVRDTGSTGKVQLLLAAQQPAASGLLALLPLQQSLAAGTAWPVPPTVNLTNITVFPALTTFAAGSLAVLLDNAAGLSALAPAAAGFPLAAPGGAGAALVFTVPHRAVVAEVTNIQIALACADSAVAGAATWRVFSVAAALFEAAPQAGSSGGGSAAPLPAVAADAPAVGAAAGVVACLLNSGTPAIATLSARAANWPALSGGHSYAIALSANVSATSSLTWLYAAAASPGADGGLLAGAPSLGSGAGASASSVALVPNAFVAQAVAGGAWAAVASAGSSMPAALLLSLGGYRSAASQLALDTALAGAATALASPADAPAPLMLSPSGTGAAVLLANAGGLAAQLDNVTVWLLCGGTPNNTGAAVALTLTLWAVTGGAPGAAPAAAAAPAPLAPLAHLRPMTATAYFAPLATTPAAAPGASAAFAPLSAAAQAAGYLSAVPAAVPVSFAPAPGQGWPPVPPGSRFALVLSATALPPSAATPAPFNASPLSLWWDASVAPPADGLLAQPVDGQAALSVLGAAQGLGVLPLYTPLASAPAAGAWAVTLASASAAFAAPALAVRATPVTMPVYDSTQGGTRLGGRNSLAVLSANPFSTTAGMAYVVLDTDPAVSARLRAVSVWVSLVGQTTSQPLLQKLCVDLVAVDPVAGGPTTTQLAASLYPEVCTQVSIGPAPMATWPSAASPGLANVALATFVLDGSSAASPWPALNGNPYGAGTGLAWQALPAGLRVALAFSAPGAASSNVYLRYADPALAPLAANATGSPLRVVQSFRSASNGAFLPVPDGFAMAISLAGADAAAPAMMLVGPVPANTTFNPRYATSANLPVAIPFTVLPAAARTVGNAAAAVALALPSALQPGSVTLTLQVMRSGLVGVTAALWTADPFLGAPLAAVLPSIAPPVTSIVAAPAAASASVVVTLPLRAWPLLAGGDTYALVVSCNGSGPAFAASAAGAADNACSSVSLRLATAAPGPQTALVGASGTVELLPTWGGVGGGSAAWQPLAAAVGVLPQVPPCPVGWAATSSGTCWLYVPAQSSLTQPAAQAFCAALAPGGGLFSVLSWADYYLMKSALPKPPSPPQSPSPTQPRLPPTRPHPHPTHTHTHTPRGGQIATPSARRHHLHRLRQLGPGVDGLHDLFKQRLRPGVDRSLHVRARRPHHANASDALRGLLGPVRAERKWPLRLCQLCWGQLPREHV